MQVEQIHRPKASEKRTLERQQMKTAHWLVVAGVGAAAIAGCAQDAAESPASASEDLKFVGIDESIRLPSEGQVLNAVTQPGVVSPLESRGFSLNALMSKGLKSAPASKINLEALYNETAWYKVLADDVSQDVNNRGKQLGAVFGAPQTKQPRAFDYGYLRSPESVYELLAVVNRIDRRDFDTTATCGELRFVYRMKYKKAGNTGAFSRLPFALNVIFSASDDGAKCASFAKRWKLPAGIDTGDKYINWVATQAGNIEGMTFKQIEVNMQANRFPSEADPFLGGSAEYFLRVYEGSGTGLKAKLLENTPDVAKLRADAGLRTELADYIKGHVPDIDQGTFAIPDKFLATKLTSVSTHGTFRMTNRPFSQIFKAGELGIPESAFANTKVIGNNAGTLARLDDATCSGCHQGASIAGFHIVGTENLTKVHPLNATRVGTSAHFNADEARRKAYVTAILDGAAPSKMRPMSFLEAANPAGMHCVSGASAKAFKKTYACTSGLICNDLERNAAMPIRLGTCMHESDASTSAEDSKTLAGEPCYGGDHTSSIDPSKDKMALGDATHRNCLNPIEGTPGGLVTRACGPDYPKSDRPHNAKAGEVCAYNGGSGFDTCAASGDFSQCLGDADTFTRGLRGLCDAQNPCRDDFICQRFYDIKGSNATATTGPGFCVPTYFLFQMRVDGHADSGKRTLN
jgi:hypothetical protein